MKDKVESRSKPDLEHAVELLRQILSEVQKLVVYRSVLKDPVVKAFINFLDCITNKNTLSTKVIKSTSKYYAKFFTQLSLKIASNRNNFLKTPWQDYLLNKILGDENPFSLKAEQTNIAQLGASLVLQVEEDLNRLQGLFTIQNEQIRTILQNIGWKRTWPGWEEIEQANSSLKPTLDCRYLIKNQFNEALEWKSLVNELSFFYYQNGAGTFSMLKAFHWQSTENGGQLQGIPFPDPIKMDDLVGFDDQKDWLIRNTRYFLAGHPANNIFVYGDRGTGKSSSIKALLNYFSNDLLRIVEISRDNLNDLPKVMHLLKDRKLFFIIFIDDLSFEEEETEYKTLKAILEGSLEIRPRNILIYATSNRKHLIREFFSDRKDHENEEIRHQDTLQEKVSLADRFGIQLAFIAPDQNQYLEIVHSICKRRKLKIPKKTLERRAIQWAQLYNARSGRTARQFMDFLVAEMQVKP